MSDVPRTVTWVDGRGAEFRVVHGQPSETFMQEAFAAVNVGDVVSDVGTGSGAVALAVAKRADKVWAVDSDEAALVAGARAAKKLGLRNVQFVASDLETEPWRAWAPKRLDVVLAHLYLTGNLLARAAEALPAGGRLVVAALGPEQWAETGHPPRFVATPADLARDLDRAGFDVEALHHELAIVTAPDFGVLENAYFRSSPEVVANWKASGRWEGLRKSYEAGHANLTESRVVARGRRR